MKLLSPLVLYSVSVLGLGSIFCVLCVSYWFL